jgi:hypothetical protein
MQSIDMPRFRFKGWAIVRTEITGFDHHHSKEVTVHNGIWRAFIVQPVNQVLKQRENFVFHAGTISPPKAPSPQQVTT